MIWVTGRIGSNITLTRSLLGRERGCGMITPSPDLGCPILAQLRRVGTAHHSQVCRARVPHSCAARTPTAKPWRPDLASCGSRSNSRNRIRKTITTRLRFLSHRLLNKSVTAPGSLAPHPPKSRRHGDRSSIVHRLGGQLGVFRDIATRPCCRCRRVAAPTRTCPTGDHHVGRVRARQQECHVVPIAAKREWSESERPLVREVSYPRSNQ